MALIYKITNKCNNKIYIGKTIRTLNIRFWEHVNETKNKKSMSLLHQAIEQFGKENFIIDIIEDNIPNEKINEKEKYYISLYNAQNPQIGYNIQPGGDGGRVYSKLNESQVADIIQILQDQNNIESYNVIGKKFGVGGSAIEQINLGKSWFQNDIIYPIRKYSTTGLTIPKNIYYEIIKDLQTTNISLQDIAMKYNISIGQITAINQGTYCYNGKHPYYNSIYSGPFPIRASNRQTMISEHIFLDILYEYLFSDKSLLSITKQYQVNNSTIVYIMQGKRRRELTTDFILPIQKFKEENKSIFIKKYPNFCKEGG